jgi:hypothetical protein
VPQQLLPRPATAGVEKKPDAVEQIRQAVAPYTPPPEEPAANGKPSLVDELRDLERDKKAKAVARYEKMIRDTAGGKKVGRAEAVQILEEMAAVGEPKSAAKVGADVDHCKECFRLAAIVATIPAIEQREKEMAAHREATRIRKEEQIRKSNEEDRQLAEAHASISGDLAEAMRARDELARLRGRGERELKIAARMKRLGAQRQILEIKTRESGTPTAPAAIAALDKELAGLTAELEQIAAEKLKP